MIRLKSYAGALLTFVFFAAGAAAQQEAQDQKGAAARLAQRILDAEDHRRADDPALAEALGTHRPALKSQALLALGRIGNAASADVVKPYLKDTLAALREDAAFALGLIGGEVAKPALLDAAASEPNANVRRQIYLALGRVGDAQTILPVLQSGLAFDDAKIKGGAAQGLGLLFNRSDATIVVAPETVDSLVELAQVEGDEAVSAAFALSRFPAAWTEAQREAVTTALTVAQNTQAQALLCRVMAKLKDGPARDALIAVRDTRDYGIRSEAARALGAFPADEMTLAALGEALQDPEHQVVEQALESLARLGAQAASLADAVSELATTSDSSWIRGSGLQTLAAIDKEVARPVLEEQLTDGPADAVPSALRGLSTYGDAESLSLILPYLQSEDLAVASAAAEGVSGFSDELLVSAAKEPLLKALERHDLALTYLVADVAGRLAWTEFAPALADAYKVFRADDIEGKVAVLGALAKVGTIDQLAVIEAALAEDDRAVVVAAAEAYQKLTGTDVSDRIPASSRVTAVTPLLHDVRRAARAKVRIETTKGVIVLKMLSDAPLVAYNFVKLAKAGFYDGKTFHRVVPHFVIQGGDPRGDGYGGPGYLIRDAVSTRSHTRGTVGMASAGKDTAGSQFFINHAPNLHLDGNYTIFATTVRGIDVVDRIEVGDRVIRAVVLD